VFKEMPFYLSMQTMDARQINQILQDTALFNHGQQAYVRLSDRIYRPDL